MSGGGGGGGHTPYEAPDSLKSAQRLRAMGLISLGPIRGAVTPDKYESAFFDNTPLKNAQGEWNYQNTEINYNLGAQDQLPLEGFEMSEREVPVSAEVKFDHPLSRRVIDPDITRLRITLGVNALFSQNDQGDTYGTKVDLQVLINGQYKDTFTIDGKSSSRFHRSYILDNLPPVPFTIIVKRLTADSKSQRLQNSTFWSSYTEIIDTKLSYPNMAMVGIKTDSRYNPNFPNINFLLYGRLVKVPSNYDPDTRTYAAGIWKGDFKLAWTNNPAWVFYDLVTNKLAGLGQRLGDYGVDKFQLYQIAQYCDQLVPDGYGGFEPRMVANLWITDQRDAYSVISDMASVFRAIAVWNGVQFTAIQDRPSDPVCTYTQANVIEGKFNRQYAPLKSIFTAVEVEFADEKNFYQKAIEYVADDSMIERYGYNVKKMVAFACTSRGQARRYGKWVLETSRLEQCTINFSVGRDGLQIIPGDIIEVADKSYANLNLGGRVIAVSGRQVTLDAPIETEGESYLSYLGEDKRLVRHKILQIDRQNKTLVTLDAEPVELKPMDLWTLHTPLVSTQRYRVLTIAENDNGSYTITALQHVPQKETIVDDGASFEPLATTTHRGLLPVMNPEISTDGSGVILNFSAPFFVGQGLTYQVRLFRNGKFYQIYDDLKEPNLAFNDLPNGDYVAEIRAKNGQGQLSEAVSKTFNINFAVSELVAVSKVFGIGLSWKNPLFAPTNSAIEIWVSKENRFETARKLVSLAYPTNSYTYDGLGVAETYYFWARMVDNVNGTAGEFTPVTEGITEQSAEKLVDYLEGQLTKDSFSQQLLDGLTKDIRDEIGENNKGIDSKFSQITHGLQQEVANRTAEIQREAQQRTQALQAEARTRGTAIAQLQNVDQTQAQQISQATAKADDALAGVQAERTARIEANRAETVAREALTGRVANAESGLTSLQRTVTQQGQSIAESSKRLNAKVDGLSVGGVNLLKDSEYRHSSLIWDPAAARKGQSTYKGKYITRITARIDGSAQYGIVQSVSKSSRVQGGETYTLSLNVQGTTGFVKSGLNYVYLMRDQSEGDNYRLPVIPLTSSLRARPKVTFTAPWSSDTVRILIGANGGTIKSDDWFAFHSVKLERGTIATDWSPAPEDVEQSISAVAADLTEYKSAQATKEQAQAQAMSGLTARLGSAEGNISNIQSTKADKTEVATIARTALQSEWRSDVDTAKRGAISAAAVDAQTKADAAKREAITAAERTAQAKADAAKAQAIASASNDATSKANAAKAQAIADAAAKDEAVKRQAAQDAQAKADNAKAQAIAEAQKLNQATSAKITNLEQTVTQQNQASATRHQELSAKFDSLSIGGRNYILQSKDDQVVSNPKRYHIYRTSLTVLSQSSVFSVKVKNLQDLIADRLTVCLCNVDDINRTIEQRQDVTINNGQLVVKFNAPSRSGINGVLVYANSGGWGGSATGSVTYYKAKLELGTVATDWSPAPEDLGQAVDDVSSQLSQLSQAVTTQTNVYAEDKRILSAQLATATATLSSTSKAVTALDGTVKSLHTIQATTIAGGRKAVAGIAFGSNGGTQSEIILMADKLQLVRNAQDGSPVPVFTVAQNRVAIRGDLIADHTILGRHLKANETITSPRINGGEIVGNNISGSTVTGSTINGGVIRGARIEGVTGKFTGELEVTQLTGGNIFDFGSFNAKYVRQERRGKYAGGRSAFETYKVYRTTIFIPKAKVRRRFRLTQEPRGYSRDVVIPGFGSNPQPQTVHFPAWEKDSYSISPQATSGGVGVWVLEPNKDYTATCEVWCLGDDTGSVAKYECILFDQSTLITQL